MKSTDVIISGGGVPGLSMALLLAKAGLSVIIADPAPPVPPGKVGLSSRTVALMEGSLGILDNAGLLEKVENESEDLRILSIADRDFRADFASHEIGMKRFGQNIQISLLQAHAASECAKTRGVTLLQATLTEFKTSGDTVTACFSDGTKYTAKLLIGADGRNSMVRRTSGIDLWEHDYGQSALTGVVTHTKPHHYNSIEFHYSGGPFTFVPMKENRCAFVWMEKTPDAQTFLKKTKTEIEAVLQARSQNVYGSVKLLTPLECYPIKIQKAKRLVAERVALIAEAAHVISPIGAQGLNLSLRDVASLSAKIIQAARLGLDIGGGMVLKSYEDDRLLDLNLRIAGTDILNRVVATENSFLSKLRRLGFKAVADINPLRLLMVRESLAPHHSLTQEMLSGLTTRATVKTSTRDAPAA